MKVYADHAATTKLDVDAFEAMKPFLFDEFGNASQPYSFARAAKAALQSARAVIAKCIHAEPEEIYFTSGGTESDNWAVKSTAAVHGYHCEMITSQIEHHAILRSCHAIERMGGSVIYLPADRYGIVRPDCLSSCMSTNTKLVSVMLANNEIGSIQPIRELCEIAHLQGAWFHTDAVQAVGHIPVDVKELQVDMLSASAHKFNGPKGVGFLYLRRDKMLETWVDGGAQEFGMRAGTENVAAIAAMAAALEKNCRRMTQSREHLRTLEKILIQELRTSNIDFRQNGSVNKIPGNISLSFKGAESEMLLHRLDFMGICVSAGSACDSKNTELSHVLRAIHVPQEYAFGTIRISLGYENTEEDVRYIARSLIKILKG